ncbi:MAG: proteasome assembly chaperone family protein [Thermoplasmatales archaeon]|nr:proteasome assembly chaperone family protein [Thermoplasmatales archaeon]MCW6170536.1 proteasome assembly chaperone family protein [Thermoplasmatales archaeon]
MEKIIINQQKKIKLNNPILIEGLPGIGNVGKIAAEYIVEKLKMEKYASIFSEYLPPQVFMDDSSVVRLVSMSLYYKKMPKTKDLLVLVGDFQGTTQEGQYELSYFILELAKKLNVSMIYTLGGYSIGKIPENPRVLGAITNESLLKPLMAGGVVFPKGEPGGGIVGSAGLILGLGKELFDLKGACLMGETSGYFADPKGARVLVKALVNLLNLKIDIADLDERSKQIEQITEKMEQDLQNKPQKDDLGYFG